MKPKKWITPTEFIEVDPDNVAVDAPVSAVRWLRRKSGWPILQQCHCVRYSTGKIEYKWRDVPIEEDTDGENVVRGDSDPQR